MAQDYMYNPERPYCLHHEFESYLYCAIWHGVGYDEGVEMPRSEGDEKDVLYACRAGPWIEMTSAK